MVLFSSVRTMLDEARIMLRGGGRGEIWILQTIERHAGCFWDVATELVVRTVWVFFFRVE